MLPTQSTRAGKEQATSDTKVLDASGGRRPGERLAFRIDRGELARTAVHGADLQERGVFGPAAKGLPEEARGCRGQVIHCNARVSGEGSVEHIKASLPHGRGGQAVLEGRRPAAGAAGQHGSLGVGVLGRAECLQLPVKSMDVDSIWLKGRVCFRLVRLQVWPTCRRLGVGRLRSLHH